MSTKITYKPISEKMFKQLAESLSQSDKVRPIANVKEFGTSRFIKVYERNGTDFFGIPGRCIEQVVNASEDKDEDGNEWKLVTTLLNNPRGGRVFDPEESYFGSKYGPTNKNIHKRVFEQFVLTRGDISHIVICPVFTFKDNIVPETPVTSKFVVSEETVDAKGFRNYVYNSCSKFSEQPFYNECPPFVTKKTKSPKAKESDDDGTASKAKKSKSPKAKDADSDEDAPKTSSKKKSKKSDSEEDTHKTSSKKKSKKAKSDSEEDEPKTSSKKKSKKAKSDSEEDTSKTSSKKKSKRDISSEEESADEQPAPKKSSKSKKSAPSSESEQEVAKPAPKKIDAPKPEPVKIDAPAKIDAPIEDKTTRVPSALYTKPGSMVDSETEHNGDTSYDEEDESEEEEEEEEEDEEEDEEDGEVMESAIVPKPAEKPWEDPSLFVPTSMDTSAAVEREKAYNAAMARATTVRAPSTNDLLRTLNHPAAEPVPEPPKVIAEPVPELPKVVAEPVPEPPKIIAEPVVIPVIEQIPMEIAPVMELDDATTQTDLAFLYFAEQQPMSPSRKRVAEEETHPTHTPNVADEQLKKAKDIVASASTIEDIMRAVKTYYEPVKRLASHCESEFERCYKNNCMDLHFLGKLEDHALNLMGFPCGLRYCLHRIGATMQPPNDVGLQL